MDSFLVEGGKALSGAIAVQGAKNAALPILVATLLTDEPCVIHNVPDLRDIRSTLDLIEYLGKSYTFENSTIEIKRRRAMRLHAPYDLVKRMRASFLVAGPLLARFGEARVAMPGGCAIGLRPIDIHLKGFEAMGAKVSYVQGDVMLKCKALKTGPVALRFPSVGATQDLMMAASAMQGTTIIKNAAREPEIEDLADFLARLGAHIDGAGSSTIRVTGTGCLHGAEHTVIPDRIETGTYLIAAAMAGGSVQIPGGRADHLRAVIDCLKKAGASVREIDGGLRIEAKGRPRPVSIQTKPYPGFPTDLQAPWMAYMTLARGKSRIRETLFEKRFIHAAELIRMGARIAIQGDTAIIDGVAKLVGAPIMASDIRAGAALVVAALAAQGPCEVQRVYHIDRGYERIELKLRRAKARIRRIRSRRRL